VSEGKKKMTGRLKLACVLLVLVAVGLAAVSCGSKTQTTQATDSSSKLPPGTTAESVNQTSSNTATTQSGSTSSSTTSSSTTKSTKTTSHQEGVTLEGVNFTVTKVTRSTSNSAVVSGNSRELTGDFLQIDLTIQNASGSLADLSGFSYRLYSTAIDASSYTDYYGNTTTYGGYVKKNTISAGLLSTSTLQPVSYVLRDGEKVDSVFLFYDLNPLTTDSNSAFTLDGADLIFYDSDTATKAEINLGAFASQ
jgi:cytoskeletal protein RodZ